MFIVTESVEGSAALQGSLALHVTGGLFSLVFLCIFTHGVSVMSPLNSFMCILFNNWVSLETFVVKTFIPFCSCSIVICIFYHLVSSFEYFPLWSVSCCVWLHLPLSVHKQQRLPRHVGPVFFTVLLSQRLLVLFHTNAVVVRRWLLLCSLSLFFVM